MPNVLGCCDFKEVAKQSAKMKRVLPIVTPKSGPSFWNQCRYFLLLLDVHRLIYWAQPPAISSVAL